MTSTTRCSSSTGTASNLASGQGARVHCGNTAPASRLGRNCCRRVKLRSEQSPNGFPDGGSYGSPGGHFTYPLSVIDTIRKYSQTPCISNWVSFTFSETYAHLFTKHFI